MTGGWGLAARLARRDLSRSLRGLRLLFLCVFLGVATLATIGSLSRAITGEIADRGALILGGDVEVGMTQRRADAAELASMRQSGRPSETIRMQAMARVPDDPSRAVLTELKGVDNLYPLYGSLVVDGRAVRAPPPGQVFIAADLAQRLGIARGSALRFGTADFTVAGLIDDEPDRVGEGFTLGPVAIVALDDVLRTGLVQPGSLYNTKYRLKLPAAASPDGVIDRLRAEFPAASWEFRDRNRAAPGASRFFDRMGQFLTLIGLAALVIAGIGVSNGVASYLRRKRAGIATLKMLGATSLDIGRVYLLQIGAVAGLAILAGLLVGALLPPAAIALLGDLLPVQPGFAVHPLPLAASAAYGVLIALLFVLPPLDRARSQPVAGLFRDHLVDRRSAGWRAIAVSALALAAIVALALLTSDNPLFAGGILAAMAGTFLVLGGLGLLVRRVARALPRPRRPLLRLAVTGLYRPGAQTVALIVALGLALTLFVTLAAVQTSIAAEVDRAIPDRAPDQFVLDIPSDQRARFEQVVKSRAPGADMQIVPTMRGTITAYGDQRVADLDEPPPGAWFLRGERGVTYSAAPPEGSDVVAGQWWPEDYRGPPLVSLDREAAEILGLSIGDTLTVSVLGREIEARIASLREIHWDSMGFNYIMVFPPATLEGAPHGLAATITLDAPRKAAVSAAVLAAFPSVSLIDVGEVVGQVATILRQMSTAIFVAASIAILAGIAVLVGALAASREARAYDSVILKTLGATRRDILAVQALEYGLLALVVGSVSLLLGLAGSWLVVVQLFEFTWNPDWPTVLLVLLGGAVLTIGIALVAAIPLLKVRPAQALRQL